jgi:hypothetical protein
MAPDQWPSVDLPTNAGQYLNWYIESEKQHDWMGKYDWTLQTYLHLKDAGYPCQLVSRIPDEGIILSHRDFLNDQLSFSNKTLLVCLISDKGRSGSKGLYSKTNVNVVQNPSLIEHDGSGNFRSYFIRHWPQAGLIPRDDSRGTRFENVRFYGETVNLIPQLRTSEWKTWLKQNLNLDWQIVPRFKLFD